MPFDSSVDTTNQTKLLLPYHRGSQFCLVGALQWAWTEKIGGDCAYQDLQDVLGFHHETGIEAWNDAPGRTQAEVLERIDQAISRC